MESCECGAGRTVEMAGCLLWSLEALLTYLLLSADSRSVYCGGPKLGEKLSYFDRMRRRSPIPRSLDSISFLRFPALKVDLNMRVMGMVRRLRLTSVCFSPGF